MIMLILINTSIPLLRERRRGSGRERNDGWGGSLRGRQSGMDDNILIHIIVVMIITLTLLLLLLIMILITQ